jgi:hypothetical protein
MVRRDGWGDWLGIIDAQPASKNNNKNDNKNKLKQGKKVMKTIKINCSSKKGKIQKLSRTMKMIKIPLTFTNLWDLRDGGTVDEA